MTLKLELTGEEELKMLDFKAHQTVEIFSLKQKLLRHAQALVDP